MKKLATSQTRKPCKECPWIIDSQHNKKWREWVDFMNKQLDTSGHRCHMVDSKNIWKESCENNKCKGYELRRENKVNER